MQTDTPVTELITSPTIATRMLLPAVICICEYTHVYWRNIDWVDTKYFYIVLNHQMTT